MGKYGIQLDVFFFFSNTKFVPRRLVLDPKTPNIQVTRMTLVCNAAPGSLVLDLQGECVRVCAFGPATRGRLRTFFFFPPIEQD